MDESQHDFTPSLFPFQSSTNAAGTHYRRWKLIAAWNLYIFGFILRAILFSVYSALYAISILLNIILNLFGLRLNLVTFHTLTLHFFVGCAVPKYVDPEFKSTFRVLRNGWLSTWPLFWYF